MLAHVGVLRESAGEQQITQVSQQNLDLREWVSLAASMLLTTAVDEPCVD
jgi:hypothetical protein